MTESRSRRMSYSVAASSATASDTDTVRSACRTAPRCNLTAAAARRDTASRRRTDGSSCSVTTCFGAVEPGSLRSPRTTHEARMCAVGRAVQITSGLRERRYRQRAGPAADVCVFPNEMTFTFSETFLRYGPASSVSTRSTTWSFLASQRLKRTNTRSAPPPASNGMNNAMCGRERIKNPDPSTASSRGNPLSDQSIKRHRTHKCPPVVGCTATGGDVNVLSGTFSFHLFLQ